MTRSDGTVGRWVENGLAILGGLLAAAYILGVEVLPHVLYSLGRSTVAPADHGFPWGVALIIGACILPKTLGRVSAGRIWSAGVERFLPGAKPKGGDDATAG